MSWQLLGELVGMAASVGLILFRLGAIKGKLDHILENHEKRITKLESEHETHALDIERLKTVVNQ